jgi:hypothetical protein
MTLPRYERQIEQMIDAPPLAVDGMIGLDRLETALAESALTAGGRDLMRGLAQLGRPAMFPGGGAGIEYGSLLKTAANPDYLANHVQEAAAHLRDSLVDVLIVPGMSGYPIGSMYAIVAGLPAVLLKKQRLKDQPRDCQYPAGSFVIPSYTGDGDVVMSADLVAIEDIVRRVLTPQLVAQSDAPHVELLVRLAGADDIIDKATMSQAVSDSGLIVGQAAVDAFIEGHRAKTGDARQISGKVQVVSWVTPLIKGYNRPQEHLQRLFGVTPFAGLNVTGVQVDPPAIGIEGLGVVRFD